MQKIPLKIFIRKKYIYVCSSHVHKLSFLSLMSSQLKVKYGEIFSRKGSHSLAACRMEVNAWKKYQNNIKLAWLEKQQEPLEIGN